MNNNISVEHRETYDYFDGAMSYTRVYNIWRTMKQRCANPNCDGYRFYGEKGIKVCDEWMSSSKAFIEWVYSHGYRDDLEIDRINSRGDYEPSNCRRVTHEENNANRIFDGVSTPESKADLQIKKLEKEFGFMGEEWLEEMRGYIRKNNGLE